MGFKAKDIKGLLVLADALEDKSGSEIMATMEGEPGRFFEMLLKTVKKS